MIDFGPVNQVGDLVQRAGSPDAALCKPQIFLPDPAPRHRSILMLRQENGITQAPLLQALSHIGLIKRAGKPRR